MSMSEKAAASREAEQHAAAMRSGMDTLCKCGHELGEHDLSPSVCMECDCKGFRARESEMEK